MKIKTLLNTSSYVSIGVMLVMVAIFSLVSYQNTLVGGERTLAGMIRNNIYERMILRDEYFNYREDRARRQWRDKSSKIGAMLKTLAKRLRSGEDREILENMIQSNNDTLVIFNAIVENDAKIRAGGIEAARIQEYDKRLFSQLIVKSYELSDEAARLRASLNEAAETARDHTTLFLMLFLVLVVATVIVNGTLIGRILKNRIGQLRRGAEIIGGGDLDHRITIGSDDELSSLARVMNEMAGNLSGSYTSVENLQAEIAGRRRAEEEVRASEERYRHTLDNMMEGCQLIGFDYRYLYINDSAARHGRKPREELVGRTMQEAYPGIEDTELFTVIKACMSDRVERRMENRFVYPDGSFGWFELSIEPAPEGVFILSIDINERKKAEEEIAWLAKFPSENPNPVLRVNGDGILMYANEGSGPLLDMWGCAVGDPVPPDWRDMMKQALAANKEKVIDLNCRGRILSVIVAPLAEAGYVNLYGSDITERKRAEEELRTSYRFLNIAYTQRELPGLLDRFVHEVKEYTGCTAVGIRILDGKGKIPYQAYDGFSKDFFESESPLSIHDDRCMCINVIKGITDPRLSFYTEGGSFYMNGTTRFLATVSEDEKGETRNVCNQVGYESVALVPIRLDESFLGLIHVADARENMVPLEMVNTLEKIGMQLGTAILHRKAENEVRQLNAELETRVMERTAQLEAANNELEAFSYSVSHDLRAPLRAIDGFSKVVLDKYSPGLDDEAQRYLNIIRNNTRDMSKLIDDLLSFSRIGRKTMRSSRIDMERLARESFEQVRSQYPGRAIDFKVASPPAASGDADMIRIVLTNLFSNAAKFTKSRPEAAIEFGGHRKNGENEYFVKDNGVGFDMKYADKLFGVFQRLHSKEEFEGTGVGLALVQRIILRHGGRVWADAAVDRGAVFHFTLPAQGGNV